MNVRIINSRDMRIEICQNLHLAIIPIVVFDWGGFVFLNVTIEPTN